jgi:hypothetical protein
VVGSGLGEESLPYLICLPSTSNHYLDHPSGRNNTNESANTTPMEPTEYVLKEMNEIQ